MIIKGNNKSCSRWGNFALKKKMYFIYLHLNSNFVSFSFEGHFCKSSKNDLFS